MMSILSETKLDTMENLKIIPIKCLDDIQLEQTAMILYNEWGSTFATRLEHLTKQRQQQQGFCDGMALVSSIGEVLGHAELKRGEMVTALDSIGAMSLYGIVTSVVIHPSHRGKGYGTLLMKLLEDVAISKYNYCYLYLWTSDAADFYKKIGYSPSDTASIESPALNLITEEGKKDINDILMRRLSRTSPTSIGMQGASSTLIWLRKRLLYKLQLFEINIKMLHVEISTKFGTSNIKDGVLIGSDGDLKFYWCSQIGPSCGIAALTMAVAWYCKTSSEVNLSEHFFRLALSQGFSSDGEIFDIDNLCKIANASNDFVTCNCIVRDTLDTFLPLKAYYPISDKET